MVEKRNRRKLEYEYPMRNLDILSAVLIFIGAINWGIIGIFSIDVIDFFLANEFWDRVVYVAIGAAAVYHAIYIKAIRVRWKER
jgi:uncharacterized protein